MATGHMFTNRGKLKIVQGDWDDAAGTEFRMAYLTTQAASMDTAVEVADLNFLNEVIPTSTEATFTNYARATLTRSNASEDDANDRVNLDASDVVIANAGGATNNTLVGAAHYEEAGGTDATRVLISIDWFATSQATNGGTLTYAITDLYRAA
jgi:hypothetical protein